MGVLWFVLGAAGAFVLALPVALWFDALRAISLNAPSGTHVSGVSVPLAVVGVVAGMLLVGLGLPVGAHHLDGYRAAQGGGGWALATGVAVFTLGVAVASRGWVAADRVGWVVTDYEPPEPWGWGQWILYYADLWLPGLLVMLSMLLVWSAVRAQRRSTASAATRDRLLTEGLRKASCASTTPATTPAGGASRGHRHGHLRRRRRHAPLGHAQVQRRVRARPGWRGAGPPQPCPPGRRRLGLRELPAGTGRPRLGLMSPASPGSWAVGTPTPVPPAHPLNGIHVAHRRRPAMVCAVSRSSGRR
ncbi:hypothetical protein OG381_43670 [Streptomyces sp. NBC_00490]|uniref:hypothetical protein n=1 Tax=Streptomyces sp. NBC_00490 TaxID=2903657 RepID=UPI002E197A61